MEEKLKMEILSKLKEPLEIKQIDFRIQSITKKGFATVLAYKDARTDMNRLDAVCGALWQDKYELIDGQLFCSIGIKIGEEWIWRMDVGTESSTEAQKGRASDAFKRAGFRWGIGRELYDFPRINMMLRADEFKEFNGKGKQTYNLKLQKWSWEIIRNDQGEIQKLIGKDENGALRYDSTKDFNGAPSGGSNTQPTPQPKQVQSPQQPDSKPQTKSDDEKAWLNKMSKDGKNFTRQWLNVIQAKSEGKITSIAQVRRHYKVGEETANSINELLNS